MKTTRFAKMRFMILGLSFISTTGAYAVGENLTRFAGNTGRYIVSSEPDSLCANRYSTLDLEVDVAAKSVNLIFSGNGHANGIPTAGEEQIFVSITETWERHHFPGKEYLRNVVKGNEIITQSSIRNLLGFKFGAWTEDRKLMKFTNTHNIVVYGKDGVGCNFVRK